MTDTHNGTPAWECFNFLRNPDKAATHAAYQDSYAWRQCGHKLATWPQSATHITKSESTL